MDVKTKIYYDKDYDQLLISQKQENEKIKHNFMFDDFTISLTGSGKIVAIEVFSASEYLDEMGINSKTLENIQSAEIIIEPKRDFIFIGFMIHSNLITKEGQIRVPLATLPRDYIKA
ncbi:MAG: hypothetical protein QT05_C0009G0012 [archaeon GW2011_AR13]|nr:MAG: hypothetical protein QT05_C0009G0012 [archaeon GW2011_AR13]HIG94430.1 hypothetical protein [Nanoarchaeota archaeon]HIH62940.1 hypothetical protein [Nanoarchaeota archaeon]HIJ10363.1 hypothetical protein [Nanoarchaeota archaeon]